MTLSLRTAFLGCVLLLAGVTAAFAQADVLSTAREAASSGRRGDALTTLEQRLADVPSDVDARLLYGLILSWEGRYDDARRELQAVMIQSPGYMDARVAAMNVAWWSGRTQDARESANQILAIDPGNQPARDVRDRVNAASRPWSSGFSYSNDTFSDGRTPWHELSASISRLTPRGSVIFRASEAHRFGSRDQLLEVEFYPKIRVGTYAFVGVGVDAADGGSLYPSRRIALDLYQALGHGLEVSGGYRRLAFTETTHIYVGTLSKYVGNWMLTGKMFHVPGAGSLDATSYHAGVRRYVRGDGTSHVGVTYSHGFSREEIRNSADLTMLDSDTVRVELDQQFIGRVRLFGAGGTSRQERAAPPALWQTSFSGGFMVQF